MSAELLRNAATRLRADANVNYERGHISEREMKFKRAVADWLDAEAGEWRPIDGYLAGEHGPPQYEVERILRAEGSHRDTPSRALAVARAYLGSEG